MTTLAAHKSAPITSKPTPHARYWIYGPLQDVIFIHGVAGCIVIPVALAAFFAPDLWLGLFTLYGLALGLPHVAATQVRLSIDRDCKRYHLWLGAVAPLVIALSVAAVAYGAHALPYLVLTWFLAQTWHANRQNFGIMRRYIRMAGSDPERLINRLAEALTEVLPWAAVVTALASPSTKYLGYEIAIPAPQIMSAISTPLWAVSGVMVAAYLVLEAKETFAGKFVPGRFLCFFSAALVNILAWVVVGEISWAYLIVSTWHALQYIAYAHAFRSSPPPGAQVTRLSVVKHLPILLVAGLGVNLFFRGMQAWIPPLVVVAHLGINFHHYLSDALIWRRPRAQQAPDSP